MARNIARYWHRPAHGLSLMHADFSTQTYAPHRHEGVVIAVTELGGAVIRSRGTEALATASALFVFNPDEPHSGGVAAGHWRYRSLYLEQPALDAVAADLGLDALPGFARNRFTDADLIAAFLALHRTLQDGRDRLAERERLLQAFGTLVRRHGGPRRPASLPRDHRRVAAAMDILRADLANPPGLESLGHAVGLTPFQLIGLFKQATGLTPHAYLTQLRLDAARRHLAAGMPIADAALAAGFYDQSALTRHFRRCYGVTPGQFARAESDRVETP